MGYHKIHVTPAEMMEMRRQGMSNRDIAKSLDICTETVRKYIGKQGGHMEGLDAFKDAPPKKEVQEEIRKPAYQPKVREEEYDVNENFVSTIRHDEGWLTLEACGGCIDIDFESIPDILQYLAWVRERESRR